MQEMDPDAPDCQTAMYCNHYPSWAGKAYRDGTLRRIAHTDFEILTLLFQRPGGALQGLERKHLLALASKEQACSSFGNKGRTPMHTQLLQRTPAVSAAS